MTQTKNSDQVGGENRTEKEWTSVGMWDEEEGSVAHDFGTFDWSRMLFADKGISRGMNHLCSSSLSLFKWMCSPYMVLSGQKLSCYNQEAPRYSYSSFM